MVSPEVKAARLAIRAGCPKYVAGRCSLCGCHLGLKVCLATESCPDKPPRWLAVTD
jgi:hypothetical protein